MDKKLGFNDGEKGGTGGHLESGSSRLPASADSPGVVLCKHESRSAFIVPDDRAQAGLHFVGVVLVGVDEKACEEAVSPVGVVEEPILLRVEDLQPDLIPLLESQDGGARGHVVVARVGVEGPDAVLAIVYQAYGQVLVGQRDVIREEVDPWHAADELAAGGIVVTALVHQDLVELDGQPLPWVALGHRH